jgi:hypothetical protein
VKREKTEGKSEGIRNEVQVKFQSFHFTPIFHPPFSSFQV